LIFFRIAFVTFENESDCSGALKAHTQISGEKVNVSYAFATLGKQPQAQPPKPTPADSTKKPTTPTEKTKKKPQPKPGLS
jgi:hypothetical protein